MFGGRASPFFPLGALRVHTKKGCCKAVRFRSSLRELELLFQFDHYAEQRLAVVRHRTGKSPVEILSRRIADTAVGLRSAAELIECEYSLFLPIVVDLHRSVSIGGILPAVAEIKYGIAGPWNRFFIELTVIPRPELDVAIFKLPGLDSRNIAGDFQILHDRLEDRVGTVDRNAELFRIGREGVHRYVHHDSLPLFPVSCR